MLGRKGLHLGRICLPVGLGPGEPAPALRIGRGKVGLQRLEQGVLAQRFALRRDKGQEGLAACIGSAGRRKMPRAKVLEQQLQHFELGGGHAGMVDQRRGPQRREPALEPRRFDVPARGLAGREIVDRLDVDVQHVDPLPRRRAVGAGARRIGREQRVQRVQADQVGALPGHAVDERFEVAEIADAPVARRAQCIELQRRPPDAAAVLHGGWSVAAAGRSDEHRFAGKPVDLQPVVAGRERLGQLQRATAMRPGLHVGLALAHKPLLVAQPPAQAA